MKSVRKKLRENRGASMIFALFVLIICVVVAVIVLRAQSASVGRTSEAVHNDRRYYSVSSAADLLKEKIDGQSICLSRTETTVITSVSGYLSTAEGSELTSGPDRSSVTTGDSVRFDGKNGPVATRNSILATEAMDLYDGVASAERSLNITISSSGGEDLSGANVSGTLSSDPEGNLTVLISSGETGRQYRIRMTFTAEIEDGTDTSSVTGTPVVEKTSDMAYTETVTETVTETRNWTIRWRFAGMERINEAE